MEFAFNVRDNLLAALAAAAADGASPLAGVEVHDSWPTKGLKADEHVIVGDFDGGEVPATMSAAGGSRDETFSLVVELAAQAVVSDSKTPRDRARVMANEVKRIVREGSTAAPSTGNTTLGVQHVRNPRIRRYGVSQFILDRGRECDVSITFDFTARHRLGQP